jgi:hypothetical protein
VYLISFVYQFFIHLFLKEIICTILYCVFVRTFVINYGSGSDFLTSYGSGSTWQKVTVPMVPVLQHCLQKTPFIDHFWNELGN